MRSTQLRGFMARRIHLTLPMVAFAVVPAVTTADFVLDAIVILMLFGTYSASWDLVGGYGGMPSFGHAIFFGVSAYGVYFLANFFGYPTVLAIPFGIVLAVACAFGIGAACIRLGGVYLVLISLAILLLSNRVILLFPRYTKPEGTFVSAPLSLNPILDYYIILIFAGISLFLLVAIGNSRLGLILRAISNDEVSCKSVGVSTLWYKLVAFVIGAAFAAMAGALYTAYVGLVSATSLSINLSLYPVVASTLGGVTTIVGAFIGTAIIEFASRALISLGLFQYVLLVYGIILIAVIYKMPTGIMGRLRRKYGATRRER